MSQEVGLVAEQAVPVTGRSEVSARADAAAYAQNLAGSGLTDVVVEASVDGGAVTVTVTGSAMDVFGGLTPRVRATVTSPIEEFRGNS